MNEGGRPLKFQSVSQLEEKIKDYFTWAEDRNTPLTIERLAVFLDTDRKTLLNYENKDEFFHTVKKAKQIIYASKAEMLNTKDGNTAGIIFDLVNNGDGYVNKQQEESNKGTTIIIQDKGKEILNNQ